MMRDELIRRLRRLVKRRGVAFEVDRQHGKGGHWVIRFGEAMQPAPQTHGRDLHKGTLHAVVRGLGLRLRDLE